MITQLYDPAAYAVNLHAIPMVLTAISVLVAGATVFIRERFSRVSLAFFVLAVACTIWLFCFAMMYCSTLPQVALWWAKLAYLGVPFIPAAIYHVSVDVLHIYPARRRLVWGGWLLSGTFSVLIVCSDILIVGLYPYRWGFYPRYGWFGVVFLMFFLGFISATLHHFWQEYHRALPGPHRARVRSLFVAMMIGSIALVDYLPKIGIPVYPFGYVPLLVCILLLARAVWRYHLIDITPAFAAKQIIETMADLLLVFDRHETVRLVNQTASDLFGYAPQELIGHSLQEVDDLVFSGKLAPLVRARMVRNQELLCTTKSGTRRMLGMSVSVMHERNEQTAGTVCVARDITERKRAEEDLRLLQTITQAISQAEDLQTALSGVLQTVCHATGWNLGQVWIPRVDRSCLECGPAWYGQGARLDAFHHACEPLTFAPDMGLPGRAWSSKQSAWMRDVSGDTHTAWSALARTYGLRAGMAVPIVVGENEVVAVLFFNAFEVREEDPRVVHLLSAIAIQLGTVIRRKRAEEALLKAYDELEKRVQERTLKLSKSNTLLKQEITERRQAELALRTSEERFRIVARATNDAVWDWDLVTQRIWWNEGVRTLFHYAESDVGSDATWRTDHIHPEDRERVVAGAQAVIVEGGRFWSDEYRYRRADGSYAYVYDRGYVIQDHKGQPIRMIGAMMDMTERKRDEHELARQAKELARSNAELDSLANELRAANARLELLTLLDPLTDLLNRRGLQQALSRETQAAQRAGCELLVLLIDLDDFKQINDVLGHSAGDIVLKEMARKLKESLRATDHIARIGGDEFLILLPETRSAEGMRVAEKVRLAISETPIAVSAGRSIKVTASLGFMTVPQTTSSVDELLSYAHFVLRRSKEAGKNRVSCDGTAPKRRQVVGENRTLSQVIDALGRCDRFRAVMQPIFRLSDMTCVGYEMLSRLAVDAFEMPDDFFRVSLEGNLLTLVDHQCLKTCLAASLKLPRQMRRHLNLFPSTILNIPVEHLLEAFPADREPGAYCIEISEQQIIGDPSYLLEPIQALKRAGIHIAIDDVGFGRSCLESLILLEPDVIKIDKKCVQGIAHEEGRANSLRRVLKVAEALGAEVVGEGIESPDDLEVLKRLGVMYAQGFLLGRPVDPASVLSAMGSSSSASSSPASERSER